MKSFIYMRSFENIYKLMKIKMLKARHCSPWCSQGFFEQQQIKEMLCNQSLYQALRKKNSIISKYSESFDVCLCRLEIVHAWLSQCTHRASGFLRMQGWGTSHFSTSFSKVINRLQLAEKCNLHYKPFCPRFGPSFSPVQLGLPIPS